jgi:predicted  nucleic acid-binding Zn-ribbon protein
MSNNELKALRAELKRVKKIAFDRLERIANLTTEVAVLEDKLEDTRSDLRELKDVLREIKTSGRGRKSMK